MVKKGLLQRLASDLDSYRKLVRESYSYGDPDDYNEKEVLNDDNEDFEEDDYTSKDSQPNDIIGNIRQLALQGIQAYSQNVDSTEYEFFKKIWLMCDKACSEQNGDTKEDYQ